MKGLICQKEELAIIMSDASEPIAVTGTLTIPLSRKQLDLNETVRNSVPNPTSLGHAGIELKDPRGNSETHVKNQVAELDGYQALLTRLDPDPRRAWQAHEDLRRKLMAYFDHNHHPEAEGLAEEVLNRIAKRPDLRMLKNIVEFAFGVARNLRKENFRQTSMRAEIPDIETIADTRGGDGSAEDTIINAISARKKLECFQQCMENLSVKHREMVRRYYPAENDDLEGQRFRLAADLGINVGALRTRIAYIREKLQHDFNRCYYAEHRRKSN